MIISSEFFFAFKIGCWGSFRTALCRMLARDPPTSPSCRGPCPLKRVLGMVFFFFLVGVCGAVETLTQESSSFKPESAFRPLFPGLVM